MPFLYQGTQSKIDLRQTTIKYLQIHHCIFRIINDVTLINKKFIKILNLSKN